MDLQQMQYFIEICNTGSFTKASKKKFISQQGISSSIKRLEKELGCDLFYRKQNGLVLTKHGEYFKIEVEEILKRVNCIYNYFGKQSCKNEKISVAITYNLISRLPKKVQV